MTSNPLSTPLPEQAKAVLAGVIAGLTALLPLMPDGFQWSDLVATLLAAAIGYGAVFGVPNAPTGDGGGPGPMWDDGDGYRGTHRADHPGTVLGLPADTDPDL